MANINFQPDCVLPNMFHSTMSRLYDVKLHDVHLYDELNDVGLYDVENSDMKLYDFQLFDVQHSDVKLHDD